MLVSALPISRLSDFRFNIAPSSRHFKCSLRRSCPKQWLRFNALRINKEAHPAMARMLLSAYSLGGRRMKYTEFEQLCETIKPSLDKGYEYVFFEFGQTQRDLDRRLRVVERCEGRVVDVCLFPRDQQEKRYALVKLIGTDVRETALALIQNGVSRIKGYDAIGKGREPSEGDH
jgi:hypothetical protein